MKIKQSNKGFTLLEILIVLIILGVIAGLAIPAFQGQVERSRAQEAYKNIALIRESLTRFHAQNNTFAAAAFPAGCGALAAGNLDFTPNCGPGNVALDVAGRNAFTYTVVGAANTYTVSAQRGAAPANNCAGAAGLITANEQGVVTRGSCYA